MELCGTTIFLFLHYLIKITLLSTRKKATEKGRNFKYEDGGKMLFLKFCICVRFISRVLLIDKIIIILNDFLLFLGIVKLFILSLLK
jgi:hypothetical protein